jgi:ankyrin repeat protein
MLASLRTAGHEHGGTMTTDRPLPAQPDLDQLRRQAKDLVRSARAGDSAALARFRVLPACANATDAELRGTPLALHDAQSVIAREHGSPSWNALRERVEEVALAFDAAVVAFIEAATEGRGDRAERLLALHPGIPRASFHAAVVVGDAEAVEARLAREPALATTAGGPRGWETLLYVCHDALPHGTVADPDGLVAIARRLIALGANPNARFPWQHHGVRRPVLWGATFVTRLLPLADLLLESGADPDDGVTLPIAAGAGDTAALDLLHAHGADPNQPWASDGSSSLYAILPWADKPAGVRWLVEHGADVNAVFAANGETPLHPVARRWDAATAALLVEHGADPEHRASDGRTPWAVAELSGNRDVADWLAAHGAATDLSDIDRLVGACSRGDLAAAQALIAARPDLPERIADQHYAALHHAAERDDTAALEAMMACGFDPNRPDQEIGKTALHSAAHEGWPNAVRVLLAHGASVDARDHEFHGQPLVWAADGLRTKGDTRDFGGVARLLLEAGSTIEWETGEEPAEEIRDILAEWQRAWGRPAR